MIHEIPRVELDFSLLEPYIPFGINPKAVLLVGGVIILGLILGSIK